MTRAVFDANALIAALLTPDGVPAECMRAHADGRFELVVSDRLLAELEGVLMRKKFRRYASTRQAQRFVASLRTEGRLVSDPGEARSSERGPGRDYLIALARFARAHVVVSGDPHLTSLGLHDIRIATPREFLELLP